MKRFLGLGFLLLLVACGGESAGDDGGGFCKFPTFEKRAEPIKSKDAGKCDHALATMFGGDCENFHWLGFIGDPFVSHDGEKYQIWFTTGERDLVNDGWVPGIGTSTSTDGLLWEDPKDLLRDASVILTSGTPGLDEFGIETVNLVQAGANGAHHMYFTGDRSQSPDSIHIVGLATSADGQSWQKHPTPILTSTLPWEQNFTQDGITVGGPLEPSILYMNGIWKLWYTAFGQLAGETGYARIGYAESTDGINFVKNPDPVLSPGAAPFEQYVVAHDHVIADPSGKGFHLFYAGMGEDGVLRIGHAFSEDGIQWERNPNNPVIEGTAGAWDGQMAGGPSALFVDGKLQVFYMGSKIADFTGARYFGVADGSCN